MVDLGVAEHSDKLLHEVLAGDCFMEGSIAPIHQDVQQAQAEEDDTWLCHCEPSKQLVRHHLSTVKKKDKGKKLGSLKGERGLLGRSDSELLTYLASRAFTCSTILLMTSMGGL